MLRTLSGRDPFEDALPSMHVGDERALTLDEHTFRVVATEHVGCDTGRRRYRLECLTCEIVVHEATTGPLWMARSHLRDVGEGYVDPLQQPLGVRVPRVVT
jgi:hypothetical protein